MEYHNESIKEVMVVKKKRKWIKWAVLLVLALAVAGVAATMSQTSEAVAYREMQAEAGDLTTWYNFDGVVRARRTQTITAAAPDTVKTVYVQQNQLVREGDRLYRTDGGETVKAGIDGELTSLLVHEGDVLAAGAKTAEIIDMDSLEVKLSVDEYDVTAMTQGKAVDVTVLATGHVVSGTVSGLDKNGTASGDLSYYTATVDLDEAEGVLPGMQASAKVLRSHAENAVLLRMEAIQFDEYNKPYVLKRTAQGEEPVRTAITVGASDGVHCEIVEGVSVGETICVPSGMTMQQLMEMMRAAGM